MQKTTFFLSDYMADEEAFHAGRRAMAPRWPERAHDHDFFEVFLIERGRTQHWVNGLTQTLLPGDLVFIRPRDAHAFAADRAEGCQITNVIFRQDTARHLSQRYGDSIGGRYWDATGALPEIHRLGPVRFERARAVLQQLLTAERSLARIEEFLLVLTNRVADVAGQLPASAPRWFQEACSAAQSVEVFRKGGAGLVGASGRSHEHVCRTCRAVTGLTPSDYINRIRIEYAAHLLRSDETPIDAIVEACGFENSSYFYRLFKGQIGTTPRRYRAENLRDPF